MGSALPLYTSSPSPPLPPPLSSSPSPIDLPPFYPIMSQINLHEVIQQQQEQLAAIQVQIQALLVAAGGATTESNSGLYMEVAKPAIFNGEAGKVGDSSWHVGYF